MSNIIKSISLLLLLSFSLFTACKDKSFEPTITLLSKEGFVSQNTNVFVSDTLHFSIRVERGDWKINELAINENNVLINKDRILSIPKNEAIANNPIALDTDGATIDVGIISNEATGTYTYNFVTTATNGDKASTSVQVITTAKEE